MDNRIFWKKEIFLPIKGTEKKQKSRRQKSNPDSHFFCRLLRQKSGHAKPISNIQFFPLSNNILSSGLDRALRFWKSHGVRIQSHGRRPGGRAWGGPVVPEG